MRLRELQYLVAVAEERHFARAAAACHITQPTLSTQLKKLEQMLGVPLFERTSKHVRLTPFGESMVPVARDVLQKIQDVKRLARAQATFTAKTLRLGIIRTVGPYLLPWFLPLLREAYPDLDIAVQESCSQTLLRDLHDHHLDAVITALPLPGGGFEELPVFEEPILVACCYDTRSHDRSIVDQHDLADQRLIVPEDADCLGKHAASCCHGGDPVVGRPRRAYAVSIEAALEMVAAGLGYTLVPALASAHLARRPSRVAVHALACGDFARRIGIVQRPGFHRADTLASVQRMMRENLPREVTPVAEHV